MSNNWTQGTPAVTDEIVELNIHKKFWNQWNNGETANAIKKENNKFTEYWDFDYVNVLFVVTDRFRANVDLIARGEYVMVRYSNKEVMSRLSTSKAKVV